VDPANYALQHITVPTTLCSTIYCVKQIIAFNIHLFKFPLSKNKGLVGFMMLNATFSNISVISWRPVLLVEETGVTGENQRPVAKST
jgi:hypothetical protein